MKMLTSKLLVGLVALATVVGTEAADAQTNKDPESFIQQTRAPTAAQDSREHGQDGSRTRAQSGDVVVEGHVVGRDPDPNIRTQLRREYEMGGPDE